MLYITLPGGGRDLFRWAVLKTRTTFSPVHNSTSEFARPYYYSFQEIVDTTGNREKGFEGLNSICLFLKQRREWIEQTIFERNVQESKCHHHHDPITRKRRPAGRNAWPYPSMSFLLLLTWRKIHNPAAARATGHPPTIRHTSQTMDIPSRGHSELMV